MTYLSVCSGIEAASVAWEPLGMTPVGFAEIEAFPSAVLAHRFPHVTNYGDFTGITDGGFDILVGGTPCQSFSVAGLRGGLADDRGNLALEFLRLADRARPKWVVWENVPGVHSSWTDAAVRGPSEGFCRALGEARRAAIAAGLDLGAGFGAGDFEEADQTSDFDCFVGGLEELGYGVATRILDAQYFGVPQRRRRVFVVGYLGDWRRAAAVLFERHSLSGHSPPSRQARTRVAALTANGVGTCGADDNQGQAGHLIASTGQTSHCLNARGMGRQDYETETLIAHTLRGEGFDASEDGTGRGTPIVPVTFMELGKSHATYQETDIAMSMRTGGGGGETKATLIVPCHTTGAGYWQEGFGTLRAREQDSHENLVTSPVAFQERGRPEGRSVEWQEDLAYSMNAPNGGGRRQENCISTPTVVRRLTPRECERLQGFPDDWTLIPYRGKPADECPDGPRYKAIGNSMAVPVMRWIGQRILIVGGDA